MRNNVKDLKIKTLCYISHNIRYVFFIGRKYNVEVASLYYQSPELLVEFEEYDYALDLWSFGCMFSSIIFQKLPFFKGANDNDQLVKISQVSSIIVSYFILIKIACPNNCYIFISRDSRY